MGQSSSKDRRKIRKEKQTLRVPSYNGSFGRGYKFKTMDAVLNVPADNGVHNKFYTGPRHRPRSNDGSSQGVIVYTSSDSGQPVARIQHRPHTRKNVQQVFEGRLDDIANHQPPQNTRESHNGQIKIPHPTSPHIKSPHTTSPDSRAVPNQFTTYRNYSKMTVAEMNGRKAASKISRKHKVVEDNVNISKKAAEVTVRRGQNIKVQRHVPDSGYRSGTIPNRPPFVPPWGTKKDLIPDSRMFESIDAHAMKCPDTACSSLRSLATYLTTPAKNDLQRIRAIYRWIAGNVRYDMDAVLSGTYKSLPCDPVTVLHTRRAVCQGYANIFAALCREVDLMVKILTGFSKDFFFDPLRPFQSYGDCNHAWNLVYVHGEWRPVDCTWASGYIDDDNNFRSKFSDVNFLADPHRFVWSHYPFLQEGLKSSLQYQLLSRPLSLDDFNKKISQSQSGSEWGLDSLTHREHIIRVDRYVKIDFRIRNIRLGNLVCRLKNVVSSEECDNLVVARRKRGGFFSVSVYPPIEGTYILKIYGIPRGENHFHLSSLLSYTLLCLSSISGITPYPDNDGLWGVKVDAESYGFGKDIYDNDFFVTDTGTLDFDVGMVRSVTTMFKLHHAMHNIPNLNDYVTTEYSSNRIRVKVRFPRSGYYKLSLFGKPAGTEGNRVDLITDYLVQCQTALPNCKPFPKSFPFTQSCMSILVEPENSWLPANKTAKFIVYSAKLQRVLVDGKGAPPFAAGVFKGEIDPKPAGTIVSIFGNTDGGMDHDELYRFSVVDTRDDVTV